MVAIAKRMKPWAEKIVPGKQYPIDDAIGIVKQFATAKFDESVDVSVNLGVDASKSDQQVRGSTVLPSANWIVFHGADALPLPLASLPLTAST